jgi:hypothetical protein
MLSMYDVRVERAEATAGRLRSTVNTEITKSEIYAIIEFGNQKVEFDIEQPRGPDKKNPLNTFFFYKYGDRSPHPDVPYNSLRITFEERIFKLERDENAFVEQVRQINTKQTSSINSFLMKKGAGMGEDPGLGALIKKRKVPNGAPRQLFTKNLSLDDLLTSAHTLNY